MTTSTDIRFTRILSEERIRCPKCGREQTGTVTLTEGAPWPSYVHQCECSYNILESEWELMQSEEASHGQE